MNTSLLNKLKSNGFRIKTQVFRNIVVGKGSCPKFSKMSKKQLNHLKYSEIECASHLTIKEFKAKKKKFAIIPRGGSVTVSIKAPNGEEFSGHSKCHWSDNFNYKEGRTQAIENAMVSFVSH